jgi:hypothetical protein
MVLDIDLKPLLSQLWKKNGIRQYAANLKNYIYTTYYERHNAKTNYANNNLESLLAMKKKKESQVYQIKIALKGSRPPIWRRCLISGNTSLKKLHDIFQCVMGWGNYHLHQFIIHGIEYGEHNPEYEMYLENEKKVKLGDLSLAEKDKFIYEYDFGDSWQHVVTVEKILPENNSLRLPQCVKGKLACPPEDSGGIWGYQELMDTIADRQHPEREEMLEWLGDDFDPNFFDLNIVNRELANIR